MTPTNFEGVTETNQYVPWSKVKRLAYTGLVWVVMELCMWEFRQQLLIDHDPHRQF